MRLPDIASIEHPEPGRVVLELHLSAGLPAFEGHFPGHPVLPGVVQLDWAIRLAGQHLGFEQRVARDFQVKFRRVIRPGTPLTLSLRTDTARGRLEFAYRVGDMVASTGRIRMEPSS